MYSTNSSYMIGFLPWLKFYYAAYYIDFFFQMLQINWSSSVKAYLAWHCKLFFSLNFPR